MVIKFLKIQLFKLEKYSRKSSARLVFNFKLLKYAVPLKILKRDQWWLFVLLMQTEKVRNEHSHDLSVLQAISIVLDRHPELRYAEKMFLMWPAIVCLMWNLVTHAHTYWVICNVGKKDFPMRCCNGTYAEWRHGLLLMQTRSLWKPGIRQVFFHLLLL